MRRTKASKIPSPFPSGFGFSCVSIEDLDRYSPHLEELRSLSSRATTKRRTAFLLGRMAAFQAVEALGITPQPVLRGQWGEPLFQNGIVGTISHKGDTAIAAVAHASVVAGIGVDIEHIDEPINLRISTKVCTPPEADWVLEYQHKSDMRLKMVFSAKEAGFKAFFPIQKVYLNHHDTQLSWDEGSQRFLGRLLKSAGNNYPIGYSFEIGSRIVGEFIISSIKLPTRRK